MGEIASFRNNLNSLLLRGKQIFTILFFQAVLSIQRFSWKRSYFLQFVDFVLFYLGIFAIEKTLLRGK